MNTLAIILAAFLSLASSSSGSAISLPAHARDGASPGFLKFDVTPARRPQPKNPNPNQTKRAVESHVWVLDGDLDYMIQLELGTPPQSIYLSIDTGSSATWVNPDCSTLEDKGRRKTCMQLPRYQPEASSTSRNTTIQDGVIYSIGQAKFTYFTDSLLWTRSCVSSLIFGVASSSRDVMVGTAGLAMPWPEHNSGIPTLVRDLYLQRVTYSQAFSVYLGKPKSDENQGHVLFGAIDAAKFSGSLAKVPIIPPSESPNGKSSYWIHVTEIGCTKPGQGPSRVKLPAADDKGLAVVLDSGSSFLYLPKDVVTAIVAGFPKVRWTHRSGYWYYPCRSPPTGVLDLKIGHATIKIPFTDLVWASSWLTGCMLSITNIEGDGLAILGQPFFRAAYVVFDQDNKEIHVANAAECGQDFKIILPGPDGVPQVDGNCAPVHEQSGSSGGGGGNYSLSSVNTLSLSAARKP